MRRVGDERIVAIESWSDVSLAGAGAEGPRGGGDRGVSPGPSACTPRNTLVTRGSPWSRVSSPPVHGQGTGSTNGRGKGDRQKSGDPSRSQTATLGNARAVASPRHRGFTFVLVRAPNLLGIPPRKLVSTPAIVDPVRGPFLAGSIVGHAIPRERFIHGRSSAVRLRRSVNGAQADFVRSV